MADQNPSGASKGGTKETMNPRKASPLPSASVKNVSGKASMGKATDTRTPPKR